MAEGHDEASRRLIADNRRLRDELRFQQEVTDELKADTGRTEEANRRLVRELALFEEAVFRAKRALEMGSPPDAELASLLAQAAAKGVSSSEGASGRRVVGVDAHAPIEALHLGLPQAREREVVADGREERKGQGVRVQGRGHRLARGQGRVRRQGQVQAGVLQRKRHAVVVPSRERERETDRQRVRE